MTVSQELELCVCHVVWNGENNGVLQLPNCTTSAGWLSWAGLLGLELVRWDQKELHCCWGIGSRNETGGLNAVTFTH